MASIITRKWWMSKSGKSIFVVVTGNIILFVFTGFSSVLFKYSSCRYYRILWKHGKDISNDFIDRIARSKDLPNISTRAYVKFIEYRLREESRSFSSQRLSSRRMKRRKRTRSRLNRLETSRNLNGGIVRCPIARGRVIVGKSERFANAATRKQEFRGCCVTEKSERSVEDFKYHTRQIGNETMAAVALRIPAFREYESVITGLPEQTSDSLNKPK